MSVPVEADSVGAALDGLVERTPALRVHLFDESGALRRHVLCLHNGARIGSLDAPVADGDTITLLQAVSGG
jgi:molybdopterin converting factor small subunit